jgi:hypothetical protein
MAGDVPLVRALSSRTVSLLVLQGMLAEREDDVTAAVGKKQKHGRWGRASLLRKRHRAAAAYWWYFTVR